MNEGRLKADTVAQLSKFFSDRYKKWLDSGKPGCASATHKEINAIIGIDNHLSPENRTLHIHAIQAVRKHLARHAALFLNVVKGDGYQIETQRTNPYKRHIKPSEKAKRPQANGNGHAPFPTTYGLKAPPPAGVSSRDHIDFNSLVGSTIKIQRVGNMVVGVDVETNEAHVLI